MSDQDVLLEAEAHARKISNYIMLFIVISVFGGIMLSLMFNAYYSHQQEMTRIMYNCDTEEKQ